jgi:hypothetical protein
MQQYSEDLRYSRCVCIAYYSGYRTNCGIRSCQGSIWMEGSGAVCNWSQYTCCTCYPYALTPTQERLQLFAPPSLGVAAEAVVQILPGKMVQVASNFIDSKRSCAGKWSRPFNFVAEGKVFMMD